jgi:hypothetical protein
MVVNTLPRCLQHKPGLERGLLEKKSAGCRKHSFLEVCCGGSRESPEQTHRILLYQQQHTRYESFHRKLLFKNYIFPNPVSASFTLFSVNPTPVCKVLISPFDASRLVFLSSLLPSYGKKYIFRSILLKKGQCHEIFKFFS